MFFAESCWSAAPKHLHMLLGWLNAMATHASALEPSERKICEGDVLVIDTGSTRHGYFCDFNREFSFGPLNEKLKRIYDIVWDATEVGIKATEPGRTLGDIWQQMSTSMQKASEAIGLPFEPFALGRMGHGVGLRMCETPSIAPGVNTIVEPGMVLTIEPSMAYQIDVGGETRVHVCVHEENVAVTTNEASLLNRRAPREMPTIG
ncbi:M24 family metallopeptidase [Mesorhizobium atlanticum]